jgi:hypothetical protein
MNKFLGIVFCGLAFPMLFADTALAVLLAIVMLAVGNEFLASAEEDDFYRRG